MLLTPLAVLAGALAGLLRGGRFENVLAVRVHWWPAVVGGLALQTLAELVDVPGRLSIFIIGSFVLIVGLSQNLHIRGAAIVIVGLTLNLLVVVANGHVPTRLEALIGIGEVPSDIDPDTILSIGGLGELETDDTQLAFLGDIIPLRLLDDVVSFGDLILVAGLFVVSMNLIANRRQSGISVDELLSDELDLRDSPEAQPSVDLTSESEPAAATDELAEPISST